MPFDGLFLKKISEELQILQNGKISKIQEASDTDFIFTIRSNFKTYNLLISLSNEYFRIHITNKTYTYPKEPKAFTMLLRKYLEGNVIKSIDTFNLDRVLIIECSGLNEMGDMQGKKLIIELMGKFSNMILTGNDKIIDAYKKEASIEAARIIFPNATYTPLKNDKINPYLLNMDELNNYFNKFTCSKDITNTFMGISLPLANYIMESIDKVNTFYFVMHGMIKPTSFNLKNKLDFYHTSIGFNEVKEYDNLSSMLDDIYYDKAEKEYIKQKSNNLLNFVEHNITKLQNKLSKLNNELNQARDNDLYRLYGELLIANSYINKKMSEITVTNYYNNENVTIPLDIRYNIIDNSKLYYKKYQKSKNAINFISEQINITNDEIEYFTLIKSQIENASISDILEIQDELNKEKYINIKKKKEKKVKYKILTYILDDGTHIYVGKNNIQNELITHKLSHPGEMWFHVKDFPGSHVVIKKDSELSEYEIRTCAMLASFYSPARDSSSVAVNYTKIRYIKKIPGKRNCFVTFTNEKTIYIDPDKDYIDSLKCEYTNI